MTQQFDNDLRGVLFRNNARREGKQDADYRGSCDIGGVAYYIDAWIKVPKAGGDKFMSLRFKAKELKPRPESSTTPAPEPVRPTPREFNDDIPF